MTQERKPCDGRGKSWRRASRLHGLPTEEDHSSGGCQPAITQRRRALTKVLVVELKGNDRGAPTGGLPDDGRRTSRGAILAPVKVLVPLLAAGVEKGYLLIALRVDAVRLRPLVTVAQRASQPQVIFCGKAASSLGNDVLHVHRHGSVCLRGQAVATSVAGRGSDFLSQGLANVRARHGPPQFSCVGTR